MELRQLVEQMLARKLQELNNNADEFIKFCSEIILLSDQEQLAMIESFRAEAKLFIQAQKDALEAEKLKSESELTKSINALTALEGKIEKVTVIPAQVSKSFLKLTNGFALIVTTTSVSALQPVAVLVTVTV